MKMSKGERRHYELLGAGLRAQELMGELNGLAATYPELGLKGHSTGKPKTMKASKVSNAKPHWTQTPEGKARLSKMMKAQWKTGKLGAK